MGLESRFFKSNHKNQHKNLKIKMFAESDFQFQEFFVVFVTSFFWFQKIQNNSRF